MSGYVELHCHTNFSLLDGASHPEEIAARARELGMSAIAITDHEGLYGAVRFARACEDAGVKPIVGAELTLATGNHVVLLARNNAGYSNICRLVSTAQLSGQKGAPRLTFEALAENAGDLICLSACRLGEIPAALLRSRPDLALETLHRYLRVFGEDRFYVELQHHDLPGDTWLRAALAEMADRAGVRCVATNDVHYATVDRKPIQDVLVCIRTRTTLEQTHSLRRRNGEFALKSADEMATIFRRYPDALANTLRIASECAVDLHFGAYRFPPFEVPGGKEAGAFLEELTLEGARARYRPIAQRASDQIDHELRIIAKLGLSEYFLIVWDIVRFAREAGILAQGRGSAANSIVAYCLGITNVDPIRLDLLFERFLSEERAGTPDIDIDFANSRREEVIQYVYGKYGADHTAMVCTVVTFHARSAIRDVGKALGLSLGTVDRLAKRLWSRRASAVESDLLSDEELDSGFEGPHWRLLFELCRQIDGFPRHLSIHTGGMLITARPLVEIVPLERATMPGRVVCQFDKDDVEALGLVKIDILALGMLSAVQDCLALVREQHGITVDLATLPLDDPAVYDLLCSGDTVGLFQVESRAQMATLPRLRPRTFYDIITEIAIIRPGPIQGQMVHPFIMRKQGKEEVVYLHPSLEPILAKTLGVCLFQEQVIKIGVAVAGFTPGEADLLRRAMGGHRSHDQMERLRKRFVDGAASRGVAEDIAATLFHQLEGFASYGFPESHAAAFAKIVYDSAYLKLYYPAEFYCALLNNWPMGFYPPAVIVGDARRHGIPVLPIDVNRSRADCTVEGRSVRIGFRYVRGIGESHHEAIDAAIEGGPFASLHDFCRRTQLEKDAVANLIDVGAFDSLGLPRRRLLWQLPEALKAAQDDEIAGLVVVSRNPPLEEPTAIEEARSDYHVLGLPATHHVMDFYRARLDDMRVLTCVELGGMPDGSWVRVGGVVICRQQPHTAKGHVFLTIEDETALGNVIIRPKVYAEYRLTIRHQLVLIIEGRLQNQDGSVSVLAKRVDSLNPEFTEGLFVRSFR